MPYTPTAPQWASQALAGQSTQARPDVSFGQKTSSLSTGMQIPGFTPEQLLRLKQLNAMFSQNFP
jgi:hypothetical protein